MLEALPQYPDHLALEEEVLAWWESERIFERLRNQNESGPKFSFIDGPVYRAVPELSKRLSVLLDQNAGSAPTGSSRR